MWLSILATYGRIPRRPFGSLKAEQSRASTTHEIGQTDCLAAGILWCLIVGHQVNTRGSLKTRLVTILQDDLENIDQSKMPTFDVSGLGADLMAHVSALESLLCMAGIATPEMLNSLVAQCRQNFDQQLAKLRETTLGDKLSPSQIAAWWKIRAREEGVENWTK